MRILIADDSLELPQQWQDVLNDTPPAAPRGASTPGKQKKSGLIERVVLACDLTAAARSDYREPAGAVDENEDEDGCPPAEPISSCPPCDLGDQPELLATILDALGVALLNRGCLEQGKRFIDAALEIRLEHFGKNHPATAASYTSRARVLRHEDELIAAEKEVDRALRINRKIFGNGGLPVAVSLVELGAIQLYQGDFRGAEKSALRGLAILKKHRLSGTDPNFTRLLDVQGRALEGRQKFNQAARVLALAVEVDEKQLGSDHPKYATHRANLATVQWAQGRLDEAKDGFEQAIRIYEEVLKRPAHPNLVDTHANLGSVLVKRGDLDQARMHLCKALGLNRQLRGPAHTLVGNDHANLGRLYHAKGEQDRARQQFRKALQIYKENVRRRRLPKDHPYIAEAKSWLKR